MSASWTVTEAYQNTDAAEAFGSLDRVFALEGDMITGDPISYVRRVRVGDKNYYVKCYTAGGKKLRRYIGRNRIQAEWENLLLFERLGIPVAPVVAYGQEKRLTMLLRGASITEEVVNTTDLAALAKENSPLLKDPEWVDTVIQQVARATRILHQYRFIHNDLKWRNILVTTRGKPQIYLIDCPAGARWVEPLLGRRKIKDIACLDKVARKVLSAEQRSRFFRLYKGHDQLTPADKKEIAQVIKYFEGRE